MTAETIAELARLEALATPGPWKAEGRPPNMKIIFAGTGPNRPSPCMFMDGDQTTNAALIVAARNALPSLLRAIETAEDAFQQIEAWAEAYPLSAFPEPDLAKARELLAAGGITIDAVAASNMRHVIQGVQGIVAPALSAIRKAANPTDGEA